MPFKTKSTQNEAIAKFGLKALSPELNLDLLMDEAVNLVAQIFDIELVKILELLPDNKQLLLKAGVGWEKGLVGRATVETGLNSQAGFTLKSIDPVIVQNLRIETRFSGPALLIDHGVVSGLSVIIKTQDTPYGVFGVHSRKLRQFTEDEINFLQSMANVVALAICRKKAETELKTYANNLEHGNWELKEEIKAREKVEASLRENAEEYRFLADIQPAMIWGSGTDKLYDYFNKVWLDFTGRTLEQELGNGWAEGVHPYDLERCLKTYTEAFDQRQPFKMEYRLRKADGSYAWVQDHGTPHYSLNGDFLGYMGTCVDISERRQAAEKLKAEEEKYRSVFEFSNDAIMVLTERGFLDCNPRTLELFGLKDKLELTSCHPSDLSPPLQVDGQDSFSAANKRIAIALKRGTHRFEWIHRRKNGVDFPAEVTLSTIDYCGKQVLQSIVRDLTEKKAAEEDIEKKETCMRLIQSITTIANKAENLEEAIQNCLHRICQIIGWPVGHAYSLKSFDMNSCRLQSNTEEDSTTVVPMPLWHLDDPEKFKLFKKITERTSLGIGVGLPGRVLDSGHPEWVVDVTRDPNFSRAEGAPDLGIRSGFAFPVFMGNTVVAILEFFSLESETVEHCDAYLEVLGNVSSQLGRVIERQQAKNELIHLKEVEQLLVFVAEHETRTNVILNSVAEAVIAIDERGIIELFNPAAEQIFGYKMHEVMGQNVNMLMPEPDKSKHSEYVQNYLRTGVAKVIGLGREVSGRRKNGSTFPMILNVTETKLGNRRLFIGAARDITEQRQSFDEIARLRNVLETENAYLRQEIKAEADSLLVGKSPAIQMVFQKITMVAHTDACVLIQGESGTGKELVAQSIHNQSPRSRHLLVKTNCGGIPRELFESEFFGHVKGAFTGASDNRVGRFELAHKGTLFLDEISELPLELQTKLLRILQEGQFEKVGEGVTRQVDVRIIAATNRNLEEEVKAGRFRTDLYYRLNVFPITIPPLRERIEDIDFISQHLLERIYEKLNYRKIPLKPNVIQRLKKYHWPGNVRELQNVLERAVILTHNGLFELNVDLIDSVLGLVPDENPVKTISLAPSDYHVQKTAEVQVIGESSLRSSISFIPSDDIEQRNIEEYRRQNILAALQKTNWKISGPRSAAELLRLKPTTLISRMKKLGIEKPR